MFVSEGSEGVKTAPPSFKLNHFRVQRRAGAARASNAVQAVQPLFQLLLDTALPVATGRSQ